MADGNAGSHEEPQEQQPGVIEFPSLPVSSGTQFGGTTASRWTPRRPSLSFSRMPRRSRGRSISEQTQDAVKQIAPPVSIPLVILCLLWYLTSAISSNLSKAILLIFDYPVSLTMVQFVYAAAFSSTVIYIATRSRTFASIFPKNSVSTTGLIGPQRFVLKSTAPMAGFQIVGHIFSHSATSQIPVSLVHAIKSLSPLLTVSVYTFVFGARYNLSTYLSLIPLTLGVIMACSAEFKAKPFALLYAFMGCVVFVSQNIWSKVLLTTGSSAKDQGSLSIADIPERKLDKMTILFWCAAGGFVGTLPIWILSDGASVIFSGEGFVLRNGGSFLQLLFLVTLNGFSHFCQNLLSFIILGSISTVAYSIASLLKRIVVITAAIFWFGQRVSVTQGWGIVITFAGLYIYDRFGSKTTIPVQRESVLPK